MKEEKYSIIALVLGLLALWGANYFAQMSDKTGAKGTFISFMALLGCVCVFVLFFRFRHVRELKILVEEQKKVVKSQSEMSTMTMSRLRHLITLLPLPWLFKDEDYADIEKASAGDIVVISPDLFNVTKKKIIKNVVKDNLSNGRKYTYIFPNKNEYVTRFDNLKSEFSKSNTNSFMLEKRPIPETQFNMIAVSHITILNFNEVNDSFPEVYLQLPVNKSNDHDTCDYWIKCDEDAAKNFVSRVYPYLSHNEKKLK